jgi:hypothetical protein
MHNFPHKQKGQRRLPLFDAIFVTVNYMAMLLLGCGDGGVFTANHRVSHFLAR